MPRRTPVAPDGSTPVGNFGWMPDISTNISYLGVRGFQRIPGQSLQFRLPVRSRHRHFSDARHEDNRTATSATRLTAPYSAATATSGLPRRNGAPSRSARRTRPTRTRPQHLIRSLAMIGDYGVDHGQLGRRQPRRVRHPASATRSGTNCRSSAAASSSMYCSRRARTAPTTATISPPANPIARAAMIRPAAQIRSCRAATARSAMR